MAKPAAQAAWSAVVLQPRRTAALAALAGIAAMVLRMELARVGKRPSRKKCWAAIATASVVGPAEGGIRTITGLEVPTKRRFVPGCVPAT